MLTKITTICLLIFCSIVVYSCSTQKTTPSPAPVEKETVVKDQILILLEGRGTPNQIVADLKAYEAKQKGPTSRSKNQWIISYNMNLIKPEMMLEKIRSYKQVTEAEFLPIKTEL